MAQLSPLLVVVLALALASYAPQPPRTGGLPTPSLAKAPSITGAIPNGQPAAFRYWLTQKPDRMAEFQAFERFLVREKVDGILPTWSLLWVDRHYASQKCPTEPFVLPPQDQWPKLIPTLKVIRDKVQPAIGPVEVVSGYRTASFNACMGGAPRSAHLQFGALDLIPVTPFKAKHEPFLSLCRMWRQSPTSEGMGLGAYYDADDTRINGRQRFHIDTFGKRTWGFGYGSKTSFWLDTRSQ